MTIDLNGVQVYYERVGKGKPLLLLHGWGGRAESWAPVLRDFEGVFDMVALDFPGHARSSDPPMPWSVTEYAEMTAALIHALGIDGCDIVAHSFGGRVALALAATYPEQVGKMVLTGVPGLKTQAQNKPSAKSRLYAALRDAADNPFTRRVLGDQTVDKWRNALQEAFGSADYKALSMQMRKTFSRVVTQDLTPYLDRIQSPTLLFWGELDTAAPLWMGQEMQRRIPDAGLVVMPNCGHFAYLDRYADFKAVLASFLAAQ